MKEIGIEELGKLLREYSYENHDYYWTLYVNGKFEGSVPGTDHDLSNEEIGMVIKSKEYGFIKWLVENDKIDIDKLKFQSDFMFPLWKDFDQLGSEDIEEYSDYESLLMLLSISDTPIEDLILYLK